MNKILKILTLLAAISTGIFLYGYFNFGLEGSKDLLVNILQPYLWKISSFQREQYYFMGAFLSPFIMIMAWAHARLFPMTYLFLLGSFVFLGSTISITDNGIEVWSYGFVLSGIMFLWVFFFLEIMPKLAQRKLNTLKQQWFLVQANFINTVSDYSVKVNGRPRQKAVVELIHPHTDKKITLESRGSFDPYFLVNKPETIDVYFDRFDPEKYIFDIK